MAPAAPDTPGQPIPGVRYRRETRTRHVEHTVNGEARIVPEEFTTYVPVPPRDWDRIVLAAVTGAAVVLVIASVAWSTASIGDLLARAVVPAVAYLAAVVFDLAWMSCLALEWLARYDPDKARGPRRAGHLALLAAMAAVCVHGYVEDSFVVGAAGAVVSALAKGMWTIVLRHHARPLDERTRAWLTQKDAEISARLALAARLRHLDRVEGQHAALLTAGRPDTTPDQGPDRPDESGQHDATVRSAVLAAAEVLPNPTAEDVLKLLSASRIEADPDTVSALLNEVPATPVLPLHRVGQTTVADSVRTALSSGMDDKDRVTAYVSGLHPDAKQETVRRTVDKIMKETA